MLSNQGFQISLHTFKTTSSSQKLNSGSLRFSRNEKTLISCDFWNIEIHYKSFEISSMATFLATFFEIKKKVNNRRI